jgi:phosphopantothenoylcysteine decarboxylase/phosphopantothenate--cysteine ligase
MLIGFALETDNEIRNAKKKLYNKNLDCIVLNTPSNNTGMGHDTNKITIISPSLSLPKGKSRNSKENIQEFDLMNKTQCAEIIVREIIKRIK